MIFKIVCVFPVPGGPSMILVWLHNAFFNALDCDIFKPKGASIGLRFDCVSYTKLERFK